MSKRPKRLKRTTVYTSKWITLHQDVVEFPGGRIANEMHVLDFPSESVAAVITNNKDDILLEYAYRYATEHDGWEIPAGGIEKGETVTEAAIREVKEETGYTAKDIRHMYTYHPSNGISNEVFHIVRGTVDDIHQTSFDTNEVREVRWFSQDEIRSMIERNDIVQGYTLSALLLHWHTQ